MICNHLELKIRFFIHHVNIINIGIHHHFMPFRRSFGLIQIFNNIILIIWLSVFKKKISDWGISTILKFLNRLIKAYLSPRTPHKILYGVIFRDVWVFCLQPPFHTLIKIRQGLAVQQSSKYLCLVRRFSQGY
jgi:hypothetical protein